LCAIFEAVEAQLAAGFTPERDIWIVSSHDEEPMGAGAAEMVRYLSAQQVRPILVLDEGGAIIDRLFPGVEGKAAVIGVTEKGYLNIRITARSAGGHASTPPRHSPLARLAKFITSIEEHPVFPAQFNAVTRSLFTCLAPRMKGLPRQIFRHLGLFGPFMAFILPALGGEAAAMVRTTCAFTMAQGSGAPNVLPESASVTANLRIAIHERSGQVLERLEKRARAHKLTIETLYGHEASPVAPQHGPGYDGLINSLKAVFPDAAPMPYIMLAASDAHHMTELTDCVYRFCPFELNKSLRRSIHGLDERLPIASLCSAVDFYHDLVGRF
jgi:carboxypeptidase PM20D1